MLALIVTCLAGKLRKTDLHSLDSYEFEASDAWANDEWGDEEWPSEPYHKPLKEWNEPLVVEKKVPVYVPGWF